MKNLFGIYYRSSEKSPSLSLHEMLSIISRRYDKECNLWWDERAGLGQADVTILPIDSHQGDRLQPDISMRFAFAAAGRLDNRSDLESCLDIPASGGQALSDYELMRCAYQRWGAGCAEKLFGDWVSAAWHPAERQLVLARSHYGSIPLYYYMDSSVVAFATSRHALVALGLAPNELDELYIAQHLTSWHAFYGERTLHTDIKDLLPGHYLIINQTQNSTHCYWSLENTPEVHYSREEEYVDAFRTLFDEAVRCRLRSSTPVAASLSGGLDSSSVTATAARFLKESGQRLTAFTAIPLHDTRKYVSSRFGDELPFARLTADYAGNVDLHPLVSSEISPIMAIRQSLQIGCLPCHAAGNLYWTTDLLRFSKLLGCEVLLTGAAGNAGVSWTGDIFSQSLLFWFSHLGWKTAWLNCLKRTKQLLSATLPTTTYAVIRKYRMDREWYRGTAIHPDFARRIRLIEQRLDDPDERPTLSARTQRTRILMPGGSAIGKYATELSSEFGVDVRDPTADARLLSFMISVPDHVFMDPKTGIDRWLIREAMKGRVPDEVRLNRNRGRQSGDRVLRLRACKHEVDAALGELQRGPAAEYVDVEYMQQIWNMIQTNDTPEAFQKSGKILLRGIMAGLSIQDFYSQAG